MAKKDEKPTPVSHAPAKPVIAIEYGGQLYPSFQKAEGARAQADLVTLLVPSKPSDMEFYTPSHAAMDHGRRAAVDSIIENAERIHGILSRFLDAAKIEMPKGV